MEIIKYKIEGEFQEGEFYDIQIEISKCVNLISLDGTNDEDFLETINGKTISMQYKGKSTDNMCIFVISPSQIIRELKINSIL